MSRLSEIYPAGRVTLREVRLRDGLRLVKQYPLERRQARLAPP
jgi:hypothetical protein